jgi:hypothetical protein
MAIRVPYFEIFQSLHLNDCVFPARLNVALKSTYLIGSVAIAEPL